MSTDTGTTGTGTGTAVPAAGGDPVSSAMAALDRRLEDLVGDRGLTGGVGALAVLLALVLGCGHALLPGHGKTVMAFYLSQRGDSSMRSAFAVGSAVTIAHTGSVLVLGLLVSLSSAFVPARIYPWLTLATGLLIVGLSRKSRARPG